jgi:hypothetical protein
VLVTTPARPAFEPDINAVIEHSKTKTTRKARRFMATSSNWISGPQQETITEHGPLLLTVLYPS